MEENLAQWVLLKDQKYFSNLLGVSLEKCLGTEVTTQFGRVDFLYRTFDNGLLVVELETGIDNCAKLKHCESQLISYLKLKNQYGKQKVEVALLYAKDSTPERFQKELLAFASENGIILRHYSIQKLMQHYNYMVNHLSHVSGVSLGRAVALGITSISWLNKFLLPYLIMNNNGNIKDLNKKLQELWNNQIILADENLDYINSGLIDRIPWDILKQLFSSGTNFYVLKRLAEDFELIDIRSIGKKQIVLLSEFGVRFRDEIFTQLQFDQFNTSSPNKSLKDLSIGQKRLLLEILLDGNFTKIKVNIFHFLRFVHLTEGNWMVKSSTKLSRAECQYLNNIFNSSYGSRTLKDLMLQTCTFCEELGLVKRLAADDQLYDKLMFTNLGSRVYNHFEMLLHMERERYQIPLQLEGSIE